MKNTECGIQNRRGRTRRVAAVLSFCILNSGLCILSSCKSSSPPPTTKPTTMPVTMSERQDAAMKDPFGYSPWKKDERSRVSGGGIGEYDKEGMKHDMKSVFDP